MGKTNTDWVQMTNASIIDKIGDFIKHNRVQKNMTQLQLADISGLNRWTISQIENGEAINLSSLIQLLRALDCLYVFSDFEVLDEISPLEYAKLKKPHKQRVRNKKNDNAHKKNVEW